MNRPGLGAGPSENKFREAIMIFFALIWAVSKSAPLVKTSVMTLICARANKTQLQNIWNEIEPPLSLCLAHLCLTTWGRAGPGWEWGRAGSRAAWPASSPRSATGTASSCGGAAGRGPSPSQSVPPACELDWPGGEARAAAAAGPPGRTGGPPGRTSSWATLSACPAVWSSCRQRVDRE